LLVIAAPVAAGNFTQSYQEASIAFITFCFASSSGYLINDWIDRDIDRLHPTKKFRPFASGKLGFKSFIALVAISLTLTLYASSFLNNDFRFYLILYLIFTISYTVLIKKVIVLELVWISLGFVLRGVAGAAALSLEVSRWFLIILGFGSLFIVSCKRLAEIHNSANSQRKVLRSYSDSFLQTVTQSSLTITLLSYALWVFDTQSKVLLAQISIITFALALFSYHLNTTSNNAEAPERLLYQSKSILIYLIITSTLVLFPIYSK
jgi:decaprenyl-phosphate phosphoribosyltransferase